MKKGSVHIVKIADKWHVHYSDGSTSKMASEHRAVMIGWALSLGKEVIVYDAQGTVEKIFEPEHRSWFHAMMAIIIVSFLAMIGAIVWGLIWLARQF